MKSKMILILILLAVIILGNKYNERQIKNCIEAGHSENYCRYAGE